MQAALIIADSTSFVAHAQFEWCGYCIWLMCFCVQVLAFVLDSSMWYWNHISKFATNHDPCSICYGMVLFLLYKDIWHNVWVHTQTNILPVAIFCISSLIVILNVSTKIKQQDARLDALEVRSAQQHSVLFGEFSMKSLSHLNWNEKENSTGLNRGTHILILETRNQQCRKCLQLNQHERDVRLARCQTSEVAEHANATGHGPSWNDVKCIDRDPHWHTSWVKEAIQIRLHPNNINRDNGIEIPEAWMPTIRKHSWEHSDLGTAARQHTRPIMIQQVIYKQLDIQSTFAWWRLAACSRNVAVTTTTPFVRQMDKCILYPFHEYEYLSPHFYIIGVATWNIIVPPTRSGHGNNIFSIHY